MAFQWETKLACCSQGASLGGVVPGMLSLACGAARAGVRSQARLCGPEQVLPDGLDLSFNILQLKNQAMFKERILIIKMGRVHPPIVPWY